MGKASAVLLIALFVSEARGEAYRPLPRLAPAKVRSRAAGEAKAVPVPPAAEAAREEAADAPAPGATRDAGPGARAVRPARRSEEVRVATAVPAASVGRRARRVGPPPPLEDELGRVVVFASTPPLQDEAGRILQPSDPARVIVLPSPGKRPRARGTR